MARALVLPSVLNVSLLPRGRRTILTLCCVRLLRRFLSSRKERSPHPGVDTAPPPRALRSVLLQLW